MTLPEEECAFYFAAMAQLDPDRRPIFVERVANILGAYSPFCEPGPGDVDRAIRAGAGRPVDPAGDRGGARRVALGSGDADVRAGVEAGGVGVAAVEVTTRSQQGLRAGD